MKTVFFGTPEFAVPSLTRLAASRHDVRLVVSRPDKPVGRSRAAQPPPVVEAARALGLPTTQPSKLKTGELESRLRHASPDAVVVVAYGRFIPAGLLDIPARGFVNLHPSLLPRHRGPSPIQWALVCGDERTGVTTMLIDEEMDAGPVLLQREVPIVPEDTAAELGRRLAEIGADLMVRTLDGLEHGSVEPRPQPEDGVTITPMLRREMGKVDWTCAAEEVVDRLRGFTPWPGLFTMYRSRRLKLHRLEQAEVPGGALDEPGTVVSVGQNGVVVRCGVGAVRLLELQLEGRKRLSVGEFLAGEQVEVGERFD